MPLDPLKYICDKDRHLICVPYSLENLHRMAKELGIENCWFHKNHYDIPNERVVEITAKCRKVERSTIVEIIMSPKYAEAFLSEAVTYVTTKPINQVLPEYEVLKWNGFKD